MSIEKLEEIIKLLESSIKDSNKFDKGTAAAGIRLRKKCLKAQKLLKELRSIILQETKSRKSQK